MRIMLHCSCRATITFRDMPKPFILWVYESFKKLHPHPSVEHCCRFHLPDGNRIDADDFYMDIQQIFTPPEKQLWEDLHNPDFKTYPSLENDECAVIIKQHQEWVNSNTDMSCLMNSDVEILVKEVQRLQALYVRDILMTSKENPCI